MKILQVLSTLCTGGAEHCAVELTNELTKDGYSCDLLTLFDVEENNNLLNQLDSQVHHFSLQKKLGFDVKIYFRLYRFIKDGQYDVVHAHVAAIPYLLLSSLFLRRVKFVATIHSEARREAGKTISKWSRFIMFRLGLCVPVTISEESKSSFDKFYHMDAPMVYNGVSEYTRSRVLNLRDNPDQLLFIHPASCQPVKNQELLFRAFDKLLTEVPNVKLIWVGSKNSYADMFDSLLRIMPSCASYLGNVPNVRDYLADADAMCLSSIMEGMPMTIIEAFSVGCPPLCTSVGGILNMVEDGQNGMLSNNLEIDSYYYMLKRFCMLSSEARRQMRENAKCSYARFSVGNSVRGYLKIYRA